MNERVQKLLDNPWTIPVTVGVTAFGSGLGLGYILGRRRKIDVHEIPEQMELDFHVDELAEIRESVEQMRRDRLKRNQEKEEQEEKDEDLKVELTIDEAEELDLDPKVREFVATRLKEAMIEHQGPDLEEEIIAQNVFAEDDGDWNYEEEVKHRTSSDPYIIHKDEFWANELDYSQSTLTYYAGDDIMADEEDAPVYNYLKVTGPLKFGHGSGDPHVFHVRNDKNRAEYEILLHESLYSEEVLGLEIEDNQRVRNIKHSDTPKFKLE